MRNSIFFICSIFLLSSCNFDNFHNKSVDICRCLNEPGSSNWFKENQQLCNKLISDKIGVKDWKTVNFSKDSELNNRWDQMNMDCVDKMLDNSVLKEQIIDFATDEEFIKQRCLNINQKYINGKITKHEESDLNIYCFISESLEYKGYYCLYRVASYELKLLDDVDCGKDNILLKFEDL